jgi:hypothetical protein
MSQEEFELDSFANIYLDAIGYREDKANLNIKLGENELEAVNFMRERLMQYLANKHDASSKTHEMAVDTSTRKFVIVKKDLPKVVPPVRKPTKKSAK